MHAYATDQPRVRGYATIAVVAVSAAMAMNWLVEQAGFPPSWLVGAPAVAGAFGLLFKAFDRWGWKAQVALFPNAETPDIEGRYEGELISTYEKTALQVCVVIDQTWTRVSVRFEVLGNATSISQSLTARLDRTGHSQATLIYTYRNQIRPGVAEREMADHDGTAELIIDLGTGVVNGRYYNFRGQQGTLLLQRLT